MQRGRARIAAYSDTNLSHSGTMQRHRERIVAHSDMNQRHKERIAAQSDMNQPHSVTMQQLQEQHRRSKGT
jgi:hypothetical protein